MDEIGFMEAGAVRFQRRVLEILDSNYNVIGAIKPVRNEFMLSVLSRPGVKTLEVTENSRDKIFRELAEMYYYEQRYNKDL
jgi:nucleoside-triphosphatase THEP1